MSARAIKGPNAANVLKVMHLVENLKVRVSWYRAFAKGQNSFHSF